MTCSVRVHRNCPCIDDMMLSVGGESFRFGRQMFSGDKDNKK